jgi:hypothetical protein
MSARSASLTALQVVHASAADGEQLGLALHGKVVGAIDHRFPLSSPALASAPDKKSTGTSQVVKQRFSIFFLDKR